MGILQLDTAASAPTIAIHFTIQNNDTVAMLPSLHMEFAQSFDMKLSKQQDDNDIASATEHFELQAKEKVDCVARFEVLGNARKGLCLRGDLFYDIEVSVPSNSECID
jgi:AP-3 complex subunit delta-1